VNLILLIIVNGPWHIRQKRVLYIQLWDISELMVGGERRLF